MRAATGALFKLRRHLPTLVKRKVYFALVHSHLVYMVQLWGASLAYCLKRVQCMQKKALMAVYCLPLRTSSLTVFQDFARSILPVAGLFELYVRQVLNEEIHHNLIFRYETSRPGLRNREFKIVRTNVLTMYGKRSLSFLAATLFNKLPLDLRSPCATTTFVKHLKSNLLSSNNLTRLIAL